MSWYIDSEVNNGYPWNTEFPTTFKTTWTNTDTIGLPKGAWRIQQGVNSGYPFIWYWFSEEAGSGGGSDGGEISYNRKDFGDLNNRQSLITDSFFDFTLLANGATAYVLNGTQLANVLEQVNGLYVSEPPDPIDLQRLQLDFHGSNPTDYIINVFGFPFNFTFGPDDSTYPVKIGPVGLSTTAHIAKQIHIVDFGTLHIDPYFNDFRDYSPYTEIQLYLPLCGTVTLDPALYIGHDISVEYVCNVYTGSCIARIYRDDLLDKVVNGNIACQIPITAAKMGDYQNNIKTINAAIKQQETSLAMSTVSTIGSIAGGIMTGNPLAIAGALGGISKIESSIANLDSLNYELSHTAPSVSSTSSGDAVLSMNASKLKCLLMFKRTQTVQGFNISQYGRTVGFACCKQCSVSDITGYTVCSKINTNGIPATVEEIQLIEKVFTSGVYL